MMKKDTEKSKKTAITPTREQDYPSWYLQIVKEADLAEHSSVRGCMVIKPFGFSIWENIQKILDEKIKKTGHKNIYLPLFVPLSFLEKEAKHVEGFAKECAVVTHHRLKKNEKGRLVPDKDSELEEPLIVRPTSETLVGDSFSKWIKSYRDLPILINQWANIVRWEMRTRFFLRTTEFLWQEGHTAHETKAQAEEEVFKMLEVYEDFLKDYLAIPSIRGRKSEIEKFPGAKETYSLELMMQDKKALQGCTSHDLDQNFSKASDIKFSSIDGDLKYAYTTSWGMSTRIMGALIMSHSDDDGLVLPPKIAPIHVVIIPVIHKKETETQIYSYVEKLKDNLKKIDFNDKKIVVEIDTRDLRGGEKKWSWIKKGIPLILEIGPKDIEKDSVFVLRRDNLDKFSLATDQFLLDVKSILENIQTDLLKKTTNLIETNTKVFEEKEMFFKFFERKDNGGFAKVHFCLETDQEEEIKIKGITLRNILMNEEQEKPCFYCGKKTKNRVIFAKAY